MHQLGMHTLLSSSIGGLHTAASTVSRYRSACCRVTGLRDDVTADTSRKQHVSAAQAVAALRSGAAMHIQAADSTADSQCWSIITETAHNWC